MPEPVDPAVVGVASLLKSLRTRAGLQEERLGHTELPLDTLTQLDRVRELEAAGEVPLRAIVRAARNAAGLLEPTMSIVADVSLCLKLFVDVVSDPMLYADDLGHRREALLANWSALHDLRSVPAPDPPTLRVLRLETEIEALGALAAALTAPAAQDPVLGLPTQLANPRPLTATDFSRLRAEAGPAPSPVLRLAGGQPPTLFRVFRSVSGALRNSLILGSGGNPKGWPSDLHRASQPATPLSTAFGVKTMMLLEGHLPPDLVPMEAHLREMSFPGGGYATRMQTARRPEVTATVLDALHGMNGTTRFDAELEALGNDIGEFEKSRSFILATVLETNARLRPDSDLTASLIDDLLAVRRQYGQYLVWPEKAEQGLASPLASTAHTARAVWALSQAQTAQPSAKVREAVEEAAAWLVEQADLSTIGEVIERPLTSGHIERLYLRHFTAAWVIKAFVSVGLPASHPSVSAAITQVWEAYHESSALWRWRNGDVPVWMTFDAVHSLRLAALASTIPAGSADRFPTGVSGL